MRSLVDLKRDLVDNKLEELYIFTGEENLIRKIYYQKIGEIYGGIKYIETVQQLYKELEKRSLFVAKMVYVVYNDMDYLKQKERVFDKLIKLSKNNVVILVYDEIPEKGDFKNVFEDYITYFGKVTKDIAEKYVAKLGKHRLSSDLVKDIAFNCDNSYNSIVEEMDKYNNFIESNNDDFLDAVRYSMIFMKKDVAPTPKEFANAFLLRDEKALSDYYNICKRMNCNILGYLPELYSSITICLFLKIYGKWDGGSLAYNSGEYWGRVKELRELNISYNKNDLLDIQFLVDQLDIMVRSGRMKAEYAWEWLIGVIL